jgi:hypothetical protein
LPFIFCMELILEFDPIRVKKIIEEDASLYDIYESKVNDFSEDRVLLIIFETYINQNPVLGKKYQDIIL